MTRLPRLLLLGALALPALACRHPNLGEDFGKAHRAAFERQTARQGEAAGALDAEDARNVMNARHAQTPAGETGPGQQAGGQGEGVPVLLSPK